jgi:hypothetical protein
MLQVDLRDLSRGGWILATLAILAAVGVMAVLLWAAPAGLLRGRGVVLIGLVGIAAAWLVFTAGSLILQRRGVTLVRPEGARALSPDEAAARLPQKVQEYRRLRRLLRWLLIPAVGSLIVLGVGLAVMEVAEVRLPLGVVIAVLALLAVLVILTGLVT